MSRWARRKDSSHRPIVNALEAAGATVQILDGKDIPDLLVGYRGATYLLEEKSPEGVETYKTKNGLRTRKQAAGKLSDGQKEWHAKWRGHPVAVVFTIEDALKAIGASATLAPRTLGTNDSREIPDSSPSWTKGGPK